MHLILIISFFSFVASDGKCAYWLADADGMQIPKWLHFTNRSWSVHGRWDYVHKGARPSCLVMDYNFTRPWQTTPDTECCNSQIHECVKHSPPTGSYATYLTSCLRGCSPITQITCRQNVSNPQQIVVGGNNSEVVYIGCKDRFKKIPTLCVDVPNVYFVPDVVVFGENWTLTTTSIPPLKYISEGRMADFSSLTFVPTNYRGRGRGGFGNGRRRRRSRSGSKGRRDRSNSRSKSATRRKAPVAISISKVLGVSDGTLLATELPEGGFNRVETKFAVAGHIGRVMISVDYPTEDEAYATTMNSPTGVVFDNMTQAEIFMRAVPDVLELLTLKDSRFKACPQPRDIKTKGDSTVRAVKVVEKTEAKPEEHKDVRAVPRYSAVKDLTTDSTA